MDLFSIVKQECCSVNISADSKDGVLRELAKLAARSEAGQAIGEEVIYTHLMRREDQGSTGFGNGIALPHARIEGLKEFIVCIAAAPKGVDFAAVDKKKCRLLFVILGPKEAVGDHLKVLAAVSHAAKTESRRNEMIKSPTGVALYESFLRGVTGAASKETGQRSMKLMIVVLYFEDFLYNVMEYFLQEGVDGATILESAGMGTYISNVPLFAEFIGFMHERKNKSTTILAMIPADREQRIIAGIESITGDLATKQGAMIMTLDVSFYKGSMQMM